MAFRRKLVETCGHQPVVHILAVAMLRQERDWAVASVTVATLASS